VKGAGQTFTSIVSGSYNGSPTSNLVLQSYVFAAPATVPVEFSGSRGTAGTAATATSVFAIQKNGADIGTMSFAASATTATFTLSSATVFNPGDTFTIIAPATPDATLTNLAWTIMGTAS